ncbi:MAG: hypothetical protein NVSMB25_17770 [Thermoleophilaceae bacterium]
MDGFGFVVLVGGLAIFGILFALGTFYPGSGADVIDWKPTRSYETEVQLELDDVDQMIAAQNQRRRRTGRPEIDEAGVRAQVDAAEREQSARRDAYRRGDHPS